jgi:hypothetical protein
MSRDVCEHFIPLELFCQKCNSRQRWYDLIGDKVYIYDTPYSSQSTSLSIVSVEDLKYYRCKFQLSKTWGV